MNSRLDNFCRLLSVTNDFELSVRWDVSLLKYNKLMGYPEGSSYKLVTQSLARGFVTVGDLKTLGEYLPHSIHKILIVYTGHRDDVLPYFMDMLLSDLEINYNGE